MTPRPPAADCVEGDSGAPPVGFGCEVTKKAILCDQLSSLMGIRILRLVKVPGKEPVYLMELETGRIEFDIGDT